MKKNRIMRAASALLVAVLLSTCAISGTFAKYVTDATGSDSARVAKFGVTVTNSGSLFLKKYSKTDAAYTLGENTVVSADEWNVIAPGTTCSNTKVALEGKPEVAVKVTYEITALTVSGDWTDADGKEYFPVIFNVAGTDHYIGMNNVNNKAELIDSVKAAVSGYSKTYAPNTDLSAQTGDALDITWRWEFEGATLNNYQTDAKDTALGNKAAKAVDGEELKIELAVKTTVTQID